VLADGRKVTRDMVSALVQALAASGSDATRLAANAFLRLCLDEEFATFFNSAPGMPIG
jgi:hypothetical protein